MKGFPFRIFTPLLVLPLCALLLVYSAGHAPQEKDVVTGKAAQIVVGKSTWKDVEKVFGRAYLIDEPRRKRQQRVWYMVYPMREEYQADVTFVINRKTGIVEERDFGLREPTLVRKLVTEFHAPYCSLEDPWRKPQYGAIIVGESTRGDVERAFGRGDSVSECDSPERKFAVVEYSKLPWFQGRVSFGVSCDAYVVEYVTLEPLEPWPLEKALSMYGPDYCYRRFYATDEPELGEVSEYGRLVEDARGDWVEVEYRSLGVILSFDEQERVYYISYNKKEPEYRVH